MPIAAFIPAIIGGGASLISGLIGSHSANTAATTLANATTQQSQVQNDATNRAIDIDQKRYDDSQKLQQPYVDAGTKALGTIGDMLPGGKLAPSAYPQWQTPKDFQAPSAYPAFQAPGSQSTASRHFQNGQPAAGIQRQIGTPGYRSPGAGQIAAPSGGGANEYGDPEGTAYAGGSPTFNEGTGRRQSYTGANGMATNPNTTIPINNDSGTIHLFNGEMRGQLVDPNAQSDSGPFKEFKPATQPIGAFKPNAGPVEDFNPSMQAPGAFSPSTQAPSAFNPSTQAPGAFAPKTAPLSSFNPKTAPVGAFTQKTPAYAAFQAPDQFKAPTAEEAMNDPGAQFRLDQGNRALARSAAIRGNLGSGETLKAFTKYNQDYASGEYDKVYGRKLGEYQQSYNNALGQYQMGYGQNQNAIQQEETQYGINSNENQNQYAREAGEYGINAQANTDTYNRELQGYGTGVAANQEQYNRELQGYGSGVAANQEQYNRELQGYGSGVAANKEAYSRETGQYGINAATHNQNLQQEEAQYGINTQANQDQYNRELGQYQLGYGRDTDTYNRQLGQYQMGYNQNLNTYNQQLQQYQMGYNNNLNNYLMNYNQSQQQQTTDWNRLASIAGLGQQSAGQLGNTGLTVGNAINGISLGNANAQSALLADRANAQAAGGVGSANAWAGAVPGVGNSISALLAALNQRGNNTYAPGGQTIPGWSDNG